MDTDSGLAGESIGAESGAPSGPETRNRLRRARQGIDKLADVEVQLRDGTFLLADVYRPVAEGRYPAIVRLGVYGKAFRTGSVCDEASRRASEAREAAWFEQGPPEDAVPSARFSENIVSANVFDWVPRGYVCVRVDGRGVGRVPGVIDPFSQTEADDYYDVIQWAAAQPWSDGAVGLLGGSYHATIQWAAASRRPPALRAMIPWSGDGDPYRDLSYPGGILIRGYREAWVSDLLKPNQCDPDPPIVDIVARLAAHPFDEPEHYGPAGEVLCGPDYTKITVPFLTSVNIASTIHGRAGAEAFRACAGAAPGAQLVVVDANYWEFMYRDCLPQQFAFFDHHLRGDEHTPEYPPVRMIMRTGHGSFEWREDTTWPPAGTDYHALYLDAAGPGALSPAPPGEEAVASYPAEVDPDPRVAGPGAGFESAPLAEGLEVAGHVSATLWVSATASDMDVYASLRVVDPDGTEVPYTVRPREPDVPVAFGCLKVSHRALDPTRTTVHRPWHTHRRADHAPLRSAEDVVPVEVDLGITTARIPAGHRLRLEVQPFEGRTGPAGRATDRPGMVAGRDYDASYHTGADNRIHTGPDHPSHIRIPVVPRSPAGS